LISSSSNGGQNDPDKIWFAGIVICLLIGYGLAGAGQAAINDPETATGFGHIMAVPYQVLLRYGGEHLVDGQVDVWLCLKVTGIDALVLAGAAAVVVVAYLWLCSFLGREKRGGGGGHGGKKNEC
jgi:hypothetical protein